MTGRALWLAFVVLLALWLGSVLSGFGGALVHLLLVLAVLDLAAGLLASRRA